MAAVNFKPVSATVSFIRSHPFLLIPFAFYLYTCAPSLGLGDACFLVERIRKLDLNTHVNFHNMTILTGWFLQFLPFGDIAYRANLVCVLYGSITLALFYWLSFTIFRSRLIAAVSALFLMVNHSMWWNSTIADVYGPNAMFTVIWLYLLYKVSEEYQDKYLISMFFISGLAIFNHIQMGFILIAAVITLIFRLVEFRERRVQIIGWCCAAFSIGFLPYLLIFIRDVAVERSFWKAASIALVGPLESHVFKTPFSFKVISDTGKLFFTEFPSPYLLCALGGSLLVLKGWRLRSSIPLVVTLAINLWVFNFFFNAWDKFCYLLPCFIILSLFGSYGLAAVFGFVERRESFLWKLLLGATVAGSLAWTVYFYHNLSRWEQSHSEPTINAFRLNEYIANPNKRNYYDIKKFCDLVFEKLPAGAVFYDTDSMTYYSLAVYYQQFYRKRLDIEIRFMNSWGMDKWGDSASSFQRVVKQAYERDQDLFLVTMNYPFSAAFGPISKQYRFKTYFLDERRWIYKLMTVSETEGQPKETFDRWSMLDPGNPIFMDLKDFNALYADGVLLLHDTSSLGNFWENNDQVFMSPKLVPGGEMGFLLRFARPAVMDLEMKFMTAHDFGIYDVYLNDTKIGSFYFFSKDHASQKYTLKGVSFEKGNNVLRFRLVGKDFKATDYRMGIDTLEMREEG